jgi:hypothetical protein
VNLKPWKVAQHEDPLERQRVFGLSFGKALRRTIYVRQTDYAYAEPATSVGFGGAVVFQVADIELQPVENASVQVAWDPRVTLFDK